MFENLTYEEIKEWNERNVRANEARQYRAAASDRSPVIRTQAMIQWMYQKERKDNDD